MAISVFNWNLWALSIRLKGMLLCALVRRVSLSNSTSILECSYGWLKFESASPFLSGRYKLGGKHVSGFHSISLLSTHSNMPSILFFITLSLVPVLISGQVTESISLSFNAHTNFPALIVRHYSLDLSEAHEGLSNLSSAIHNLPPVISPDLANFYRNNLTHFRSFLVSAFSEDEFFETFQYFNSSLEELYMELKTKVGHIIYFVNFKFFLLDPTLSCWLYG